MTHQPFEPNQPVSALTPPVSAPGRNWSSPQQVLEPRIEGYQVEALLGEGGMGTVWQAVQLSTKRPVALKLMGCPTLGSDRARARFEREVELAAGLDHAHIARVYDSGLDRGVYYYAMKLIRGVPLDYQFVKQHGLSQRQIVELMRTVCQAVEHAHQRGVIHRDLKPSNVLVTEECQPYVLDFGLAKMLFKDEQGVAVSQEGDVPGTVAFMSPEQAMGDEPQIDTRSDVYALGVMLYGLLLNGNHPHGLTGSTYKDRQRIIQEEIRRPRLVNPTIDSELEAILLKALAKSAQQRYGSAGELARDLDHFLNGDPLMARRPTAAYFLRKRLSKYRVPVAVATVMALAVLSLIVTGYVRERWLRQEAEVARHRAQQQQAIAVREARSSRRALYFNRVALAAAHTRQGHITQAVELLEACPVDLRHWEWYFLEHATDQAVETFRHHRGDYLAVVLSGDGQRVAAADYDSIQCWNTRSGASFVVPVEGAQAMTFATNHQLAWVNAEGRIGLWNLASGQKNDLTLDLPGGSIRALAFDLTNRQIVSGGNQQARIKDAGGRDLLKQAGIVCLSRMDGGGPYKTLQPKGAVYAVAWDASGQRIAAGGWRLIEVWDTTADTPRHVLHADGHALAFGSQGRLLASGGSDGIVRLWDLESESIVGVFHGHRQAVASVAFTPNGQQLVSAAVNGTTKVWNIDPTGEPFYAGRRFVSLSPTGRCIAAIGDGQTVQLIDTTHGQVLATLPVEQNELDTVIFGPLGRRVVTVSGITDTTTQVWTIPTGSVSRTIPGNVRTAVFSPDGHRLATIESDQVALWPLETTDPPSRLTGHNGPIRTLAFSGDGRQMVTGGDDGTIRIWDTATGAPLATLESDRTQLAQVAFGPETDRVLSIGFDDTIRIWDTFSGVQVGIFKPHPRIHALAFSTDRSRIATGGYGEIAIGDVQTGVVITTLNGHQEFVGALAFSGDGKRLISGGDDTTVKLWDIESGTEIMTFQGHQSPVTSVAFTADGKVITSVGDDRLVVQWQAPGFKQTAP